MDLYSLLGVSRDATAETIDRAYRRLARRYHPGVNPGDQVAEALFRQIQQAYEVLGQLERRLEYDRGRGQPAALGEIAVSFEGFDFSAPAEGPVAATFAELFADVFHRAARQAAAPSRGASVDTTIAMSFEAAVRGGSFPISVVRQERCPACVGDGRIVRPPVVCPACGGQGEFRSARGHMVFTKACDACAGSGRLTSEPCRSCAGAGVAPRSEVVTVTLPPGVEHGARVVVPGRGHAGSHGGPAGDLYVAIDVAPHPHFRREGRDLRLRLPVAVHEAALGARVDVPTLDGAVKLRIPPGAASGQQLRVRGRGVPGPTDEDPAGDLLIDLQVVLPPVLDERSKTLIREFGALNSLDVRADLFGR
jgi:molecular chaperone DnaJ